MRQLFLTGLTLGCLVLGGSSAYGCFCVTPDVPAAFEQAKAVFLGQVIDIVEPKTVDVMAPLPGRLMRGRLGVSLIIP